MKSPFSRDHKNDTEGWYDVMRKLEDSQKLSVLQITNNLKCFFMKWQTSVHTTVGKKEKQQNPKKQTNKKEKNHQIDFHFFNLKNIMLPQKRNVLRRAQRC